MKKALFLLAFVFFFSGVALPGAARAQTLPPGSFVIASQGTQDTATSTCPYTGDCYFEYIGTGYIGSTSNAYISGNFSSLSYIPYRLDVYGFSDDTYNGTFTDCEFLPDNPIGTTDTYFVQYDASGAPDCVFDSTKYYAVDFLGGSGDFAYRGTATSTKFLVSYVLLANSTYHGVAQSGVGVFEPQFSLVTGGFSISPNYTGLATSTCAIDNITGCFQNALEWAFYPPSGSLDTVSSLWGTISLKPPFGYFTATQNDISTIGASTTPTFALEQVSGISTYIFDPLDLALSGIWWAIFGLWFFFNRLRHIQI